jgi:CBS domain-containing protein
MLGFADIYDYVPGKVDWLAHNLEVEGDDPEPPTLGGVMRDDVVHCAPTDRVADVHASIKASPYPFALVTTDGGTVLGRLPASALDPGSEASVGDIAEPGPKTFRPHHSAANVARQLGEKDLRWAIVTTPEGRVLGVASRADLERAAQTT